MEALGKDIWDFYSNGWPEDYYHEDWLIAIVNDDETMNILLDEEYSLDDFGYLVPKGESYINNENVISFEEAYLKWERDVKTKVQTFDEWFDYSYPNSLDDQDFKTGLRHAWNASATAHFNSKKRKL